MPQDPSNKEHNVSYSPDPLEEYLDDTKKKPSGFFTDNVVSPTGRWTEITESNPKTGTSYSYRSSSNSSIGRGTNTRERGIGAPNPTTLEGSTFGNLMESHSKYISNLKKGGKLK